MRGPEELVTDAREAVDQALEAGADQAEAYVTEVRRVEVSCHGEHARTKESHGLGTCLRVAVDGALGRASASGLGSVDWLASQAVSRARRSPPDPRFESFPDPEDPPREPGSVPKGLRPPDPSRLEATAREALEALDSPDTTYRSGEVGGGWRRIAVANSQGLATWDQTGTEGIILEARFSAGTRDLTALDLYADSAPVGEEIDVPAFARRIRNRARDALDPKPLSGSVDAVVFRPGIAGQLVSKLSSALRGDRIDRGQSPLEGVLGEQALAKELTLRDIPYGDGHPPRRRVDGEGVPKEPRTLVDQGVVCSLMYDSRSGGAAGTGSTGHARRPGGWQGGVSVGPTHLEIEPGDHGEAELLEAVDRAVLVTDPLRGVFTTQLTTGEFSLVSPYAFLVEDGEVQDALPHTTVAGNLVDLCDSLAAVGADTWRYNSGTYPSLAATGGVTCKT